MCFLFADELEHTISISKPKYVFLSSDTHNRYYSTIVGTKIVEKFYIFDDSVSDPNILKFNDLIKTNVDIDSFKPVSDPVNGKKYLLITMIIIIFKYGHNTSNNKFISTFTSQEIKNFEC